MRSKRALYSFIFNTIAQIINTLLAIIVRKLFFATLGADLLGLNSLFSSIILYLSISELGIGQSIAMCLYKPLADGNMRKVASYMHLLKRIYIFVGCMILVLGLLAAPFIYRFTDVPYSRVYIAVAFMINVLSTAVMYFFSYKKILLSADQRDYVLSAIQIGYRSVLNILQIWVLITSANFYLFLAVVFLCNLAEVLISSIYYNRNYYFKEYTGLCLNKHEKKDIFDKVRGLLVYKVSEYAIQGTDNIIISIILGSVWVAYYSNYSLIVMVLFSIFSHIGYSSMSGLGNILYSDKTKLSRSFSNLLFIQHLAFCVTSCGFFILSNNFIKIVYGAEYVLGVMPVFLMTLVYDLRGYSYGIESLRNSAGLYSDDKIWNIVCAGLNIIFSVLFAYLMGLPGIILGTLVAYFIKELIIVPNIVFNNILPKKLKFWYYHQFIRHLAVTILLGFIIYILHMYIVYTNIIYWFVDAFISITGCLAVNVIIFHKSDEFCYLVSMIHRNLNISRKQVKKLR